MNPPKKKRITMKLKSPNPLFEKWLSEWKKEAEEKESKMKYTFSLALKSLKKYPLPFECGKDCKILKGFGDKLCKMLDDKLKEHESQSQVSNDPKPSTSTKESKTKKTKCSKKYVPQYGSEAFEILVTLYERSQESGCSMFVTKNEIISYGQRLSNVFFAKVNSTFNAKRAPLKTLLENNLITIEGELPKYGLTEEGKGVAEELFIKWKIEEFKKVDESKGVPENSEYKENNPLPPNTGSLSRQASSTSTINSKSSAESVMLAPNSFDIILLVDSQELNGKTNAQIDPIVKELRNLNVLFETRNLKVGDYVWICRDKSSNIELVLPYIVERKRMDDFGSSIKDGRFHEQKFRLKQSGLQNLIYLVESYGKNEFVGLPITTLYQAATNTLVQDGFAVKFTDSLKGTVEYLACLTDLIAKNYKLRTVLSCSKEDLKEAVFDSDLICLMEFKEFNKSSIKTKQFRVKEMFVKQLVQIKGMSVDKALAIVDRYQTPKQLKLAYKALSPADGERLLATIPTGPLKKNLGAVLSKTVYQFFNKITF